MRSKEAFLVSTSTLQRGSDCHKEAVQGPLEEMSIFFLGRSRDYELEAGHRVQRQRVLVSQTTTNETVGGDIIPSLWDAITA